MEKWKPINYYDGYEVSNLGNVRTHNKSTYTKRHGIRKWKDRLLVPKGLNGKKLYKTGYRVDLWKDGKPHTLLVARLVAFTFYGEDINNHKLTVNHKDGNRLNNNIENLELISLEDNIRHAFDNGLMPCHRIKITNKNTNNVCVYRSMSLASLGIKKSQGYISGQIKRGKFENKEYKWEVLNKKGK